MNRLEYDPDIGRSVNVIRHRLGLSPLTLERDGVDGELTIAELNAKLVGRNYWQGPWQGPVLRRVPPKYVAGVDWGTGQSVTARSLIEVDADGNAKVLSTRVDSG